MVQRVQKKLILISSLVFLMGIFACLPVATGYGTTIDTAEPIGTGVVEDTLLAGGDSAWYGISVYDGQTLTVEVVTPGNDVGLAFFGPSQGRVAFSGDAGPIVTLSYDCSLTGYYYIRIYRLAGGDIPFTMTTTLKNTIPGFELLYVFFGIAVLLGIAIHYKKKNRLLSEN